MFPYMLLFSLAGKMIGLSLRSRLFPNLPPREMLTGIDTCGLRVLSLWNAHSVTHENLSFLGSMEFWMSQ